MKSFLRAYDDDDDDEIAYFIVRWKNWRASFVYRTKNMR